MLHFKDNFNYRWGKAGNGAIVFVVSFAFILMLFFWGGPCYCSEKKGFVGRILEISSSGKTIIIKTKDNHKKDVKLTPQTDYYKKTRPLPAEFKADLNDFKKDEWVYVISPNPDSPTPTATSIWDNRAFAVKTGLQSEKAFAGEVKSFSMGRGVLSILTLDRKDLNLRVTSSTKILIDNREGRAADIRPGRKVVAYCRWPGFEEDIPDEPRIVELLDSMTFVIRKYQEKFGALISTGKVMSVNMKSKIIKVAAAQGYADQIDFSPRTRWIPATPKIKSPGDFKGYDVSIFGISGPENKMEAKLVLNNMGINEIFPAIIRDHEIQGAVTTLAFGDVIYIDGKAVEVFSKGRKVKIMLHKKTRFIKKGKTITYQQIKKGDRVKVQGLYGNPSIAILVISFGQVAK